MVNNYQISWTSDNIQYTWVIYRPCLTISSVKGIRRLYSTRNIGVKYLQHSVWWKGNNSREIISRSLILRNEQVIDSIYLSFICMHLSALLLLCFYYSYASCVFMMIRRFLWISLFNANIMLLMILILTFYIFYLLTYMILPHR